jgi:hypothetical protein
MVIISQIPRVREYLVYNSFISENGYVHLIDNKNAINPSYGQLIDFLKYDKTDKLEFIPNKFVCSEFSETLHNNAEKYGYRCAWVYIEFEDGSVAHACNAFETTDRGIIYIDTSNSRSKDYDDDMSVNVEMYREYRPIRLFPCNNHMLRYSKLGIVSNYITYWSGTEWK